MGCYFIGWCSLAPEAQAAWAQAVFSVFGIAVAILVPWSIKKHELTRQRAVDEFNELRGAQASLPVLSDMHLALVNYDAGWQPSRNTNMPYADHERNLKVWIFRDAQKLSKLATIAGPRLGIPLTLVAVHADRLASKAVDMIEGGGSRLSDVKLLGVGGSEELALNAARQELDQSVNEALRIANEIVDEAALRG